MGVEGLFSKFVNQGGFNINKKEFIVKNIPNKVRGVCIDVNGSIHPIAQKVFMYSDDPQKMINMFKDQGLDFLEIKKSKEKLTYDQLKEEFYTEFFKEVSEILKFFNPYEFIVLAVDGIVPNAKIAEQRSRRFKGVFKNSPTPQPSKNEDDKNSNSIKTLGPALGGFSNTFISPGTPFMFELHEAFKTWVAKNKFNLPPKFLYSSFETPGEGEHKIFEFLRTHIDTSNMNEDATVIWGLDNDLILLSLLSPVRNIFFAREVMTEFLDIQKFKKPVVNKLLNNRKDKFDKATDQDIKLIIQDFSVLFNLVGNDFLPSNLIYSGFENMENIYNAYYSVLTDKKYFLTTYLGEIDREFLFCFFKKLNLLEPDSIEANRLRQNKNRAKLLDVTKVFHMNDSSQTEKEEFIMKENKRIFKKTTFVPVKIEKFIEQTIADEKEAFDLLNDIGGTYITKYGDVTTFDQRVVLNYIDTFEWVLRYYTLGQKFINWDFRYPYFYAPWSGTISSNLLPPYKELKISTLKPVGEITNSQGDYEARGKSSLNFGIQLLSILPHEILKRVFAKKPPRFFNGYLNLTGPGDIFDFIAEHLYFTPERGRYFEENRQGVAKYSPHQIKIIMPIVNFKLIERSIAILEKLRKQKKIEAEAPKTEAKLKKALEEGDWNALMKGGFLRKESLNKIGFVRNPESLIPQSLKGKDLDLDILYLGELESNKKKEKEDGGYDNDNDERRRSSSVLLPVVVPPPPSSSSSRPVTVFSLAIAQYNESLEKIKELLKHEENTSNLVSSLLVINAKDKNLPLRICSDKIMSNHLTMYTTAPPVIYTKKNKN